MKHYILIILSIVLAIPTYAQHEKDFASSFMELNHDENALVCTTVSPVMMERILKMPADSIECDSLLPLLEQVKSVRVVTGRVAGEKVNLFYEKAEVLAQYHPLGYQRFGKDVDNTIYQRRRGNYIVEVVLISQEGGKFCLIDLTGNMTEDVLMRLYKGDSRD